MSQIRSRAVRLRPPDTRRCAAPGPGSPGAPTAGPAEGIRGALRTTPAVVSLALGVGGLAMFALLLTQAALHDHAGRPEWIGYAALVVPQLAFAAIAAGLTPALPPGGRRDRAAVAGSLLGVVTFVGIVVVGIVMLAGPLGVYLP